MTRLLKCGVSANASDGARSDNKVLHWAASYGTDEMVKLLCGKCFKALFSSMVICMHVVLFYPENRVFLTYLTKKCANSQGYNCSW